MYLHKLAHVVRHRRIIENIAVRRMAVISQIEREDAITCDKRSAYRLPIFRRAEKPVQNDHRVTIAVRSVVELHLHRFQPQRRPIVIYRNYRDALPAECFGISIDRVTLDVGLGFPSAFVVGDPQQSR